MIKKKIVMKCISHEHIEPAVHQFLYLTISHIQMSVHVLCPML